MGHCKVGDLALWPITNLIEPDMRLKIKLVYIFSQAAAELIFTTIDDKVSFLYQAMQVQVEYPWFQDCDGLSVFSQRFIYIATCITPLTRSLHLPIYIQITKECFSNDMKQLQMQM